ncbi:MAG TPA: nickel-dependent hydrogenase large subunit, partial [Sideroxyarcus sp.]|nr:nickel-dependent hydrogenase large subunit [Sideroxyarcus sp.]
TDIRSTRPMAAQVLKDKTAAQVLQIVPMLFSVCAHAQAAASSAALRAAQHGVVAVSPLRGRAIACEAMQEHLWRVMLDWPKLVGAAPQEKRFAGWYAMLRKISAGDIDMAAFLREFERDGLGMPAAEWRGMNSYQALQAWWRKTDGLPAQLLAKLAELEHGRHVQRDVRLLPAWSAADAQQACAGRWDADFSARPDWQGAAAETGAWSYFADSPLLRDVWQQSGSRALTRLLARLLDVVEMASGGAAPRLDVDSPAAGEGVAVVRTARGLLMHRVRVSAEQVTDYAIVAPTEWNFHPGGAFADDLRGLKECDAERVQQLAHIEALSLDPCVAYEIEVLHA